MKWILQIPITSPTVLLETEFGMEMLYFHTLHLNSSYVAKTLGMIEKRTPKVISSYILSKNILWAEEWNKNAQEINSGTIFNLQNSELFLVQANMILNEKKKN